MITQLIRIVCLCAYIVQFIIQCHHQILTSTVFANRNYKKQQQKEEAEANASPELTKFYRCVSLTATHLERVSSENEHWRYTDCCARATIVAQPDRTADAKQN